MGVKPIMNENDIKKQLIASYDYSVTATVRNSIKKWKQYEIDKFIICFKNINNKKLLDLGAGTGMFGQAFKIFKMIL